MKLKMKEDFSDAVADVGAWGFEISDIYGVADNETYSFSKTVGLEEVFINITHMRFKVTNISFLVMEKARPARIRFR
jgi:hypothetical protein